MERNYHTAVCHWLVTLCGAQCERQFILLVNGEPAVLPLLCFLLHAICREIDEDRSLPNVSKFLAEFVQNYNMFLNLPRRHGIINVLLLRKLALYRGNRFLQRLW